MNLLQRALLEDFAADIAPPCLKLLEAARQVQELRESDSPALARACWFKLLVAAHVLHRQLGEWAPLGISLGEIHIEGCPGAADLFRAADGLFELQHNPTAVQADYESAMRRLQSAVAAVGQPREAGVEDR